MAYLHKSASKLQTSDNVRCTKQRVRSSYLCVAYMFEAIYMQVSINKLYVSIKKRFLSERTWSNTKHDTIFLITGNTETKYSIKSFPKSLFANKWSKISWHELLSQSEGVWVIYYINIRSVCVSVCLSVCLFPARSWKWNIVSQHFFRQYKEILLASCTNCFSSLYDVWFERKSLWNF